MYRNRTVHALLRENNRVYEAQLARKDEQIQTLLDRIQHPDRTPIWREPVTAPVAATFDPWELVPDPDQLPA